MWLQCLLSTSLMAKNLAIQESWVLAIHGNHTVLMVLAFRFEKKKKTTPSKPPDQRRFNYSNFSSVCNWTTKKLYKYLSLYSVHSNEFILGVCLLAFISAKHNISSKTYMVFFVGRGKIFLLEDQTTPNDTIVETKIDCF